MAKKSAGLLLYRAPLGRTEVFLVHPGGPFWARKDDGAWSIPKGECEEGEDPLTAAKREFGEELGKEPTGLFWKLGELIQPSKKIVTAWAVEGEFDIRDLKSNLFEMEWPPRSNQRRAFPEVDRAQWFTPTDARRKILPGQLGFIDLFLKRIGFEEPKPTV